MDFWGALEHIKDLYAGAKTVEFTWEYLASAFKYKRKRSQDREVVSSQLSQLEKLKSFVCFNQGKIVQFQILLNEKVFSIHKALSDGDKKKAYSLLKTEYIKEAANELEHMWRVSNEYIIDYFHLQSRSKIKPRVCIKRVSKGQVYNVFDECVDTMIQAIEPSAIAANTASKSIKKSGQHYCCNDIPFAVKQKAYENQRLDSNSVRSNYTLRSNQDQIDDEWCKHWDDKDIHGKPNNWKNSCYKSTLVIPMTLKNNSRELRRDFKELFFKNYQDSERTIWGMLSIDHPTAYFFNEEADPAIGYIFADILSLYFIFLEDQLINLKTLVHAYKENI